MITAGRILKELGYGGEYSIYFTFTVMEEDCDGMCWKYMIEKEGFKPDFICSTEPTSCRIYRGHRGRMEIRIILRGVSCHGSAPERGVNAAYKAAKAALAIEQLNKDLKPDAENFLGKGTICVSQMDVKGPSQCAVADYAMIYCDRRLTWGEDADFALKQVRNTSARRPVIPKTRSSLRCPITRRSAGRRRRILRNCTSRRGRLIGIIRW